MSSNVWPSNREPYHGDVIQGRLGNCFLIASLQALASCQPQLLKSIISLSSFTCFFYRQDERVEIPIVLEPSTDEYQYCRSTMTDAQWPYIIERAYAQFYGGRYENLAGGNTSEALYDLVGKPVEEFEPNHEHIWDKIEKGLAQKNALVTCGAVVTNDSATATTTTNGLVVNHAYAVLATFICQKTREKYVVIHNPHGVNHILDENNRVRQTFFTSISKSHPLWSNTQGTQLLSWAELKKTCNRIQICDINVQSRQTLFGDWSTLTCGGCSNYPTFYRNPFILLPSAHVKRMTIVLGHTTDQRHERTTTNIKLDYAQIGITIVQLKSHPTPTHDNYQVISQSKFWNKREVTLAIDIQPQQGQQYAVVLSTYYPNMITSFWIELFSQESLPKVELRTWTSAFQQTVQVIHGEWHQENAGGRRIQSNTTTTFHQNPVYRLTLSSVSTVRLILHQSFDRDVPFAEHHPIGIYVLSKKSNEEPAFVRARSVSRLLRLSADEEYYVVPACFEPNSLEKFELSVLCDVAFTVDPLEKRLPTPYLVENKTVTSTATTRKIVSTMSKPVPITTTKTRTRISPTRTRAGGGTTLTRTTAARSVSKNRNLSLAAARMPTLTDEYSKLT